MCMKKIYLSLKDSEAENIKNQIQLKSIAYFCENLHLQSCFTRVLNNSKMYSSSILFHRESLVILRNHTLVFTKGVCAPSTLLSPKKSICYYTFCCGSCDVPACCLVVSFFL